VVALYVDVQKGPYARLPGVDAWGIDRDARRYAGPDPIIAHPDCATWGKLASFATTARRFRDCAPRAVDQVRQFGGVLEHPAGSTLWSTKGLPLPGAPPDAWGGWTLEVDQVRWKHPARKSTWLYLVGIQPEDLPPIPPDRGPTHVIQTRKRIGAPGRLPDLRKSQRHLTPPNLAAWLVEVARRSHVRGARHAA
jgi:hypothetical protein